MNYKEVKELSPLQDWHGDQRRGKTSPVEEVNKLLKEGWEVISTFEEEDKYYGRKVNGFILGKNEFYKQ